ncbi:MAG: hypothetical protein ACLSA6_06100 [Holdemania massiliensis]
MISVSASGRLSITVRACSDGLSAVTRYSAIKINVGFAAWAPSVVMDRVQTILKAVKGQLAMAIHHVPQEIISFFRFGATTHSRMNPVTVSGHCVKSSSIGR